MRAQRPFARLPGHYWAPLAPLRERASAHPGGLVDLTIGSPVDPVSPSVADALASADQLTGYPATAGTPELRAAYRAWARRRGLIDLDDDQVLPTIGSKEAVGLLGSLLGLGPGDVVVQPELHYPTYEVSARYVGADLVTTDHPEQLPSPPRLVWVNSPSNPTGRVLEPQRLRELVGWARAHDVLLVSDECYLELGWTTPPTSVLDPVVCDGSADGLLVLHSLSKRSNLAGYRAGFLAGDATLVRELLSVRRDVGLIVPAPVQAAARAALDDDEHVALQREVYAARRTRLLTAFEAAGFTVEHSEAGLYLWLTRGEGCWDSAGWLAERGVLVAPGEIYGEAGRRHVRAALTVPDARVAEVATRLHP
ncbi:succinyldiaminopimelate transaminase [Nocardioides acrostichi]|uniref:Aminotransferase n=1 Tax=Nocardioides acrostichi TaxID=2784339 RepID=A0A930V288_9ACTN|nr:succinyldiaminopimelate transaminase [Nocardioides acrostichi]MBF4162390.1 succinyldiaminopimelate transaminase [Nocardioides acrostichi]